MKLRLWTFSIQAKVRGLRLTFLELEVVILVSSCDWITWTSSSIGVKTIKIQIMIKFISSYRIIHGFEKRVFDKVGILLMEEILHQLIGSLSHYLHGLVHPRWCRISSINSSSLDWNRNLSITRKKWNDFVIHTKRPVRDSSVLVSLWSPSLWELRTLRFPIDRYLQMQP